MEGRTEFPGHYYNFLAISSNNYFIDMLTTQPSLNSPCDKRLPAKALDVVFGKFFEAQRAEIITNTDLALIIDWRSLASWFRDC